MFVEAELKSISLELQNLEPTEINFEEFVLRNRLKIKRLAPNQSDEFNKLSKITYNVSDDLRKVGGPILEMEVERSITNAFRRMAAFLYSLLDDESMFSQIVKRSSVSDAALPKHLENLMSNKVFIVHGHNLLIREQVKSMLLSLGLDPVILDEQAGASDTIVEKFERHSDVSFAIVIMTADDLGNTKTHVKTIEDLRPRARQNVILELGYFFAKLRRKHVCALHESGIEIPSDFAGVQYIDLGRQDWRHKLGREMQAAGLTVDLNKLP